MNNADSYTKANGMQKRDAYDILSECIDTIRWSPGDLILDIGCGAGDVTANILLPKLPKTIRSLVGCDLSIEMVNHAARTFPDPKLSFMQLDIACQQLDVTHFFDVIGDNNVEDLYIFDGVFDKLFSFYCLHWVSEQKQAMKNMYDLLKPGGEALVLLLANCPVFLLYEKLARKSQWQEYMKDVAQYVSPYQHSSDPRKEFDDLVHKCGFHVISCRTEKRSFPFGTTGHLKKALKAVNPFLDRIPNDLKDAFLNDCVSETHNLNLVDIINQSTDQNNNVKKESQPVRVEYEIIIAHFKKL